MKKFAKSNLVKLALLVGSVAVAAKLVGAKKDQWSGLSEREVREKLESRLPDRVPEEKRTAVADKVVTTMRSRGLLTEAVDKAAAAVDEPTEDPEPDNDAIAEEHSADEPSN